MRVRMLFLVSVLASAITPAQAAPAGGGFMPPEQILQCLRDQEEVKQLNLQMSTEKEQLDQKTVAFESEQTQLNQRGEQLAEAIRRQQEQALQKSQTPEPAPEPVGNAQLDRYLKQYAGIPAKRRSYNKAVASHKERLDQHNRAVDDYNLRLSGLRQRSEIVDRHCAGAKVRQQDLQAARATLAAEAAATAKP